MTIVILDQSCIDGASYGDSRSCPLALAISAAFPQLEIRVECSYIAYRTRLPGSEVHEIPLPWRLETIVDTYDSRETLHPCQFPLDLPL